MSKKVLILSGSPRKKGNSDLLCDEFMRGAVESGAEVEKICLRDKKIGFCQECLYCHKSDGVCAVKDDMAEILDKIDAADAIVLASPVFFYSIDAQMKTLIDRCYARWTKIKNKEFYYILTAADEASNATDCPLECFRGLARCLAGSQEKGVVLARGVLEAGEIRTKKEFQLAYEMGKNV